MAFHRHEISRRIQLDLCQTEYRRDLAHVSNKPIESLTPVDPREALDRQENDKESIGLSTTTRRSTKTEPEQRSRPGSRHFGELE